MLRFLWISLFFILSQCHVSKIKAQTLTQTVQQIKTAIEQGDVKLLSAFFAPRVELSVGTQEGDYGQQQAYYLLKEFFTKYPASSFIIVHKGHTANTYYAIGAYISPQGTFDVNIFFTQDGKHYKIEQLRFERAH